MQRTEKPFCLLSLYPKELTTQGVSNRNKISECTEPSNMVGRIVERGYICLDLPPRRPGTDLPRPGGSAKAGTSLWYYLRVL